MSYKIKHYTDEFFRDISIKSSVFLRVFAEEVMKEARPNTPKDIGDLRDNVLKSVLGLKGKIKWIKDYAKYQEVKQYSNYTTPGTGPHFAENAVKKKAKETQTIAKKSGLI